MSVKLKFFLLFALLSTTVNSQSLLDDLGENPFTDHIKNAFKSHRIINGNSIEMLPPGVLDFRILHRFGPLSGGGYQLFGLDQASMRLGFDYGATSFFMFGVGRSTFRKEVDGYAKVRILWQSTGAHRMPLSLLWAGGIMLNGLKQPVPDVETTFSRRLAYYNQLIIGRKFSERFSLQLTPTWLHRNITESIVDPNEVYAVGLGGRFKFTKRVALTWDAYYPINTFNTRLESMPVALGVDIETGGHVFQLHFSNCTGMNERAFLTDSNGNWLKGEIRFGFNISRWFQIVSPRR